MSNKFKHELEEFFKDSINIRNFRYFQAIINSKEDTKYDFSFLKDEVYPIPIGIWEPKNHMGQIIFERNNSDEAWYWESTRKSINAIKASNTSRVCLIGESTAHGMFFSPYYTPAKALEKYLKTSSRNNWEIIDLTRICMDSKTLIETCKSCLQLNPNYIVIFAGNNWFADVIFCESASYNERMKYFEALNKEGFNGIETFFKEEMLKLTKSVISKLEYIQNQTNVKIIYAIPAINHKDWGRRLPIILRNEKTESEWFKSYYKTNELISEEKFKDAIDNLNQMIKIDGGKCSTSLALIAYCYQKINKKDISEEYYLRCHDYSVLTDHYTSFPSTPQFVVDEINSYSKNSNITFIDLSKIFKKYENSRVFGNELFIDYCHLNIYGFDIFGSEIANVIFVDKNYEPRVYDKNLLIKMSMEGLDKTKVSMSMFYITLYHSHLSEEYLEKPDINMLVEKFQQAVDLNKDILKVMVDYVIAKSCDKGAAFSFSNASHRILNTDNSHLDLKIAQCSLGIDSVTIKAILTCLEKNSVNTNKLKKQYFKSYICDLKNSFIDMTHPYYIPRINSIVRLKEDHEINTRRRMPYYKSRWPISEFSFITDGVTDLNLEIVARNREEESCKLDIKVNDKFAKEILIGNTWTKINIDIPVNLTSEGFNELKLIWPILVYKENNLENFIERYLLGYPVEVFKIFGEVHSLKLSFRY